MKKQLIILSALCFSLAFLNSCGKKEDASAQDPPDKKESPSGRPKFSTPSKETGSGQAAVKPVPEKAPAPVEPETPKEATDNEPNTPPPPAVVAFTTELEEKGILKLLKRMENQEEGRGQNPLAMLDMFRDLNDLNDKLKTVKMEGLPADLKEPAEQFRDVTADMTIHLEEMPIPLDILTGGQEAVGPWFAEKIAEDPLFLQSMQDWGQTMGELGGEMEEAGTDMEKAFAKYGIDSSAE
ncbi:MAG: hypothetical protein VCA40_00185 [Roseibacillus sp.]